MSLVLAFALAILESSGFTYAVAMRGCTQEDAPALEIYLTQQPYRGQGFPDHPYLRIEVAGRDWGQLVRRDLDLSPLSRHDTDVRKPLVRAEVNRDRRPAIWLRGVLRLERIKADAEVEGSYRFMESDGREWAGVFKADWVVRSAGCG
jgi:hypothetical protein